MDDLTGDALAALDGGLSQLRLGVLGVDGTVADGEDAIVTIDAESAIGGDTAAATLLEPPVGNGLVGTDASSPDDHVRRKRLTVLEEHRILAHLGRRA